MKIFGQSRHFPVEERYSLTDQIRRSSRSVAANIAEGYRRQNIQPMFLARMADADAEATETQVWIDFAYDWGYLSVNSRDELCLAYEEIGKMLGGILSEPDGFVAEAKR